MEIIRQEGHLNQEPKASEEVPLILNIEEHKEEAKITEPKKSLFPLPIDQYEEGQLNIHLTQGKQPFIVVFKTTKKYFSGRNYMAYRAKGHKDLGMINLNTPLPYSIESKAMYNKRYYLFSKFDKGIIIDEESWSSITPEDIAKHIARRVM